MMNPSKDSLLGLQLDEYRLEELLGQGGMARVYRALDVKLMRYAAIKVIDAPYRRDAEYIKRFEREAQAIAKLEHPNVVRLYRYGEVAPANSGDSGSTAQPPLLYMAMQYVQGKDLGYVLDSCRLDGEYVNPEEGLQVIRQVCQALDYVHAQGIIHRDVKPSNIMLARDDGHAVLTDFGLALMTQVGTRGETFGSPHYIAPEQAVSSARAVPQSDLYAVGVILFEMFTGALPFNAPDPLDVALLHMSTPPPAPREIRSELSEAVEKVILKALEKRPEDRYQTGKALADALEQALHWKPEAERSSRKTVLDRVSIGFAANPLPPIPAAVTPGFAETHRDPAEASFSESGFQNAEPTGLPPEAAVTPIAKVPAAENLPVEAPQAVEPPGREIPPTIRLFDETPEAAAKPMTSMTVPPASALSASALSTAAHQPADSHIPTRQTAAVAPVASTRSVPAGTLPSSAKPAGSQRWLWIGGTVLAVGLVSFLCLAGIVGLVLSRVAAPETGNAPSEPTVVAGIDADPTESPVLDPSPTSAASSAALTHTIFIGRCAEEGCVVVKNTGSTPFSIGELKLASSEGSIQGSEWGISLLLPGKCVLAAKNEEWQNRLPNGFTCDVTGHTLTREGKDRFWKDTFSVEYGGKVIGECRKGAATCTFETKK